VTQATNLHTQQARIRLTQIFRYVQAFQQLQNPIPSDIEAQPWRLWLLHLPMHPALRYQRSPEDPAAPKTGSDKSTSEDFILKVKYPPLTDAPLPPLDITPWLLKSWQDINGPIALDPTRAKEFHTDPKRTELLRKWQLIWNQWQATELPARQVLGIYEQLYQLHSQLERETEKIELMFGDGLLDWSPSDPGVYHPLLLLRLQMHFNPQLREFTISTTEHPPELYTAPLQTLPNMPLANLKHSRLEFTQESVHPLDTSSSDSFLQRFVHQLSPHGTFSPEARPREKRQFPLISRNPVIFLRNRSLGYNTALEVILEDLQHREDLPYSLLSLTGIETANTQAQNTTPSPTTSPNSDEDEQILFSKPANAEQLEIARRLDRYGAVLVQGPPGTGKTHTIANLLGHLLAQGKSVLVTSHTSKALRVLREKVVEPLQPLCVSVLADDSRKEMERAIDAITERLSFANVEILEREANQLTQQRHQLLIDLHEVREQLKQARAGEYRDIVISGRPYLPSDAARYVTLHRSTLGWIPGPLKTELPLLSAEDLRRLYQTNATVPLQDEQEMTNGLPDPQKLLSPADFEHLLSECARFQHNLDFHRNLWLPHANQVSPQELTQLQHRLVQALEPLKEPGPNRRWRLAAIAAGREGGPARKIWDELLSKIQSVEQLAQQAQHWLLEYGPVLPENLFSHQTEQTLQEILQHLEHGGQLNAVALLVHRPWKTLRDQALVQEKAPNTHDQFMALLMLLRLNLARKDLAGRWQRQMTPLGAPDTANFGAEPERAYKQFTYQLRHCLDWYVATWSPLEQELKRAGLQWETLLAEMPVNLAEYGDLLRLSTAVQDHLPAILNAECNRRFTQLEEEKRQSLLTTLDLHNKPGTQTNVIQRLRLAVTTSDTNAYREAFARLVDLHSRQQELLVRRELLEKLDRCAPGWAAAIRQREGLHGQANLPGNPDEAWHWYQLQHALLQRSSISLETLQERSTNLSTSLQKLTAELVEKKAWAAQVRRTTLEQRRALQGWKELMRKVGKGTGKRAASLLAEARNLMPICQTAVPVWIMPLDRVVQNFDPSRNHFDVVIIDEASQADIKALTAVYLGAQIVIVGDDEQVTPSAVGQNLDQLEKLIDEYLQGVPLARLYDGKLSIYSLARTTFEPICLQEHFRCVSPIIQFSNLLSYSGKIKPLRDDSEVQIRPALLAYRVKAFETLNQINEPEAQAITSLIVSALEQPEYHTASFGVISLVDNKQALYIDTLLRQYLPATEYLRHRILCGNPAQFQGDERDVVFLSMVDTPNSQGPLSMRSEDANDYTFRKRFNVAASRARDQLWVVHSFDPNVDLKDGDIRKRLILHAQNYAPTVSILAEQEQKVESEFERQVLQRLVQAGYHVISQWPVGAYRIDLVVEGNGKRLAVECDGDRWHPLEKLEADMTRQAILERLGWRFARIRGSLFFRNPDQALAPVFARLQALGIPPTANQQPASAAPQDGQELRARIVRRAAALRQQWNTPAQPTSPTTLSTQRTSKRA
jgi:very-short-patch-repair endonuclease